MNREWRSLALLLVVFSVALCPASAQTTGSILGTVTDSSGALVPNAKITARSNQQGFTRTAVTNSSGSYLLPAIPLGIYTVTVEVSGFDKYLNDAVTVDADQSVRVDAALHAGRLNEQVTVSSAPPQVDTHSDTISAIIPQTLVNDMPTSTGQPLDFLSILPGVSDISTSAAFAPDRNGPRFNVSGSRSPITCCCWTA